ncbi:hypothetical protein SK128_009638 [Halocaridina rubra]|uniref:Rhodanese domain-containing protein n=1 Tax=Halocaridina rubra TaxID=373956 RepID=A0AAN8XIR6_HALRR
MTAFQVSRTHRTYIGYATLLLLLGCASSQNTKTVVKPQLKDPQVITFEELSRELEAYTVVDIRRRDEVIEYGQIPGSHVLPLQEISEALGLSEEEFLFKYGFPKIRNDDTSIVLTCTAGVRVQIANKLLTENGYRNHRLYLGSFNDWVKNGGELIKPGKPFQPPIQ